MPNTQHELLPVIQQGENIYISALLLHRKLKIKTVYAHWIKRRIEKYGFEDGKDFLTTLAKSSGGRQATEYLLSLDMAKELSMLEENETGRQIRRYFIQKEKELRSISQLPREQSFFKGMKGKRINDRLMYPYAEIRRRAGYSPRGSSANHRNRYWMHFVKEGSNLMITEEFALHLYHQKRVFQNRAVMVNAQPVLPFNFGEPLGITLNTKGGRYE